MAETIEPILGIDDFGNSVEQKAPLLGVKQSAVIEHCRQEHSSQQIIVKCTQIAAHAFEQAVVAQQSQAGERFLDTAHLSGQQRMHRVRRLQQAEQALAVTLLTQ